MRIGGQPVLILGLNRSGIGYLASIGTGAIAALKSQHFLRNLSDCSKSQCWY
jgi:hypothetical protein